MAEKGQDGDFLVRDSESTVSIAAVYLVLNIFVTLKYFSDGRLFRVTEGPGP